MLDAQQSNFQSQYPLSRKKFWKKIISKFIGYPIYLVVFAGGAGIIAYSIQASNSQPILNAVLGAVFTVISLISFLTLVAFVPYAIYFHFYIKYYYYD